MIINPPDLELEENRRIGGSIIIPRPIILIATVGTNGQYNVAPFSLVTQVCYKPLLLGISLLRRHDGGKKDTLRNIEATQEFVAGLVVESIMEQMNTTARNFPSEIDEFKESGLTPTQADLVKAPLIAQSPINMECRLHQVLEFGTSARLTNFVIGEVVRIHIKDEIIAGNRIRLREFGAVGNLGGDYYGRSKDNFKMQRLR